MPQTICWLTSGDEAFGVRTAVLNLAKGLAEAGHAPRFVVLADEAFAKELEEAGHDVYYALQPEPPTLRATASMQGVWTSIRWLAVSTRLAVALRKHKVFQDADVIHVMWPNLLLAACLARGRKSKVVWEMVNSIGDSSISRFVYYAITRIFRVQVLANSLHTAKTLNPQADHDGWPDVMHLSTASRIMTPLSADPIVISCIARLHPSKLQHLLIQAFGQLLHPGSLELRIVGSGAEDYASELQALARVASADPLRCVTFVGQVRDSANELTKSSIVVSLRSGAEPFGLSIIEAMMSGRPVLASAAGGPSETILHGETGWLVHETTLQSVTQMLEEAIQRRREWEPMGEKAFERATSEFSIVRQANRYQTIVFASEKRPSCS